MSNEDLTLTCSRCGRQTAPLPRPPLPGKLGAEVQQRVCTECWEEWRGMEVMVINELRLNFMDPQAQRTLDEHMRNFLQLGAPPAGDKPEDAAG